MRGGVGLFTLTRIPLDRGIHLINVLTCSELMQDQAAEDTLMTDCWTHEHRFGRSQSEGSVSGTKPKEGRQHRTTAVMARGPAQDLLSLFFYLYLSSNENCG